MRAGTACDDLACWLRTITPIASGSGETDPRPVVTGEVGQYDGRSGFTRQYAAWADGSAPDAAGARPISYLAWSWNAMFRADSAARATGWRCDGGPSLLKYNDGTPTDAYGLGVCRHLRARAAADGTPLPGTDPCPPSRAPTEPPADATPVAATPTTPATPTIPTTPSTPTTPEAPTVPGAPPPVAPVLSPPTTTVPTRPAPPAGEPRTARVTSSALRLRKGPGSCIGRAGSPQSRRRRPRAARRASGA